MGKYKKCPRCELNYILESETYCPICLQEMNHHTDDEDDFFDNLEDMELCPVCGVNYIKEGEAMCEECRGKKNYDSDDEEEPVSKMWAKDRDDDLVSTKSDIDSDDDEYNHGFEEVDENEDPYKIDDDIDDLDTPIEFSLGEDEEEEEEEEEEEFDNSDDFEVVDVSDDDIDEDEEDEDDYDDDDDFLSKKKK